MSAHGYVVVTIECGECGRYIEVDDVPVHDIAPDLVREAIEVANWKFTDHTVLCSEACYLSLMGVK